MPHVMRTLADDFPGYESKISLMKMSDGKFRRLCDEYQKVIKAKAGVNNTGDLNNDETIKLRETIKGKLYRMLAAA